MKMKSMPRISKNKQSLWLRHNKGFTIIELLVVIAVIAVLSMLFVNTATINIKRGRDARRKTDLENVRSGIETFRADCNKYPASVSFGGSIKGDNSSTNCPNTNTYINV